MSVEQVIALVEKWIADPESVGQEELKVAYDAAYDAWYGDAAYDPWYAHAVYAVHAAALNGDIDDAKFWVAEYHIIIKENV